MKTIDFHNEKRSSAVSVGESTEYLGKGSFGKVERVTVQIGEKVRSFARKTFKHEGEADDAYKS